MKESEWMKVNEWMKMNERKKMGKYGPGEKLIKRYWSEKIYNK